MRSRHECTETPASSQDRVLSWLVVGLGVAGMLCLVLGQPTGVEWASCIAFVIGVVELLPCLPPGDVTAGAARPTGGENAAGADTWTPTSRLESAATDRIAE